MRKMVMFDDYTGLPRAYAVADDEMTAKREAWRQLLSYCKKNAGTEPDLADPENYTMRIVEVE